MSALVLDGHPNPGSLGAAVARAYADAHGDATVLALRDLDFDPHLREGYRRRQELEPGLDHAWELLTGADHAVIVAPIWWGSVPALLKGFFDRVLLPRRAFEIRPDGRPVGLLTGRTGRLVLTTDSPWWYLRLMGGTAAKQVRRATLRYCGIRPVWTTRFGPVKGSSDATRERWLDRTADLARRDAARKRVRQADRAGR